MNDSKTLTSLRAADVVVDYSLDDGSTLTAVAGVSLELRTGETHGLVGESGCGKSSLGRALMMLPAPTSGEVWLDGQRIDQLRERDLRPLRHQVQMVFQNPTASLNPRRSVLDTVAEPLRARGNSNAEAYERARAVLMSVDLDPDEFGHRRPSELSGGQCQRVSIARALALNPQVLICDEAVSALDVSVQAQIINMLEDLRAEFGLTMLFIAHDLAVVLNVSDRVTVMYLGRVCETAPSATLYQSPAHPYTRMLLDSVPVPDPLARPQPRDGLIEIPSPIAPPSGCRYHTRCPLASDRCRTEIPLVRPIGSDHQVACHHPLSD